MTKFANTPARTALGRAIAPAFPDGWQLVEHEGAVDDSARVRVRVAQRSVAHSDTGYALDHLVTFDVTITVPTEALETAEPLLDDELDAFLWALDDADVPWTTATKGLFGDEGRRLGYTLVITIRTSPNEKD